MNYRVVHASPVCHDFRRRHLAKRQQLLGSYLNGRIDERSEVKREHIID